MHDVTYYFLFTFLTTAVYFIEIGFVREVGVLALLAGVARVFILLDYLLLLLIWFLFLACSSSCRVVLALSSVLLLTNRLYIRCIHTG